jgi:hypothetical protein
MRHALIVLCVVVTVPLLACAADQIDPLKQLDDEMIGTAIVKRCNPSFDWNKRVKGADQMGRKAYEKILSELQAKNPTDPNNAMNADRAFNLRMEEMFRKGDQLVSEKGCTDREVQERRRKFEGAG